MQDLDTRSCRALILGKRSGKYHAQRFQPEIGDYEALYGVLSSFNTALTKRWETLANPIHRDFPDKA